MSSEFACPANSMGPKKIRSQPKQKEGDRRRPDCPTPEARRRSGSKLVVMVRDPEHYLLRCLIVHLLGQHTGFLGSLLPMFRVVEMRGTGNDMWFLFQALIFCAVVGSNIHWQWTPNQYLASGIGAGLAWVATRAVVEWRDRQAARDGQKKMRPSVHGGGLKLRSRSPRRHSAPLSVPYDMRPLDVGVVKSI
jgi:hypothetical protein